MSNHDETLHGQRAQRLLLDARERLVRLEVVRAVNARFEDAVPTPEVLRGSRLATLIRAVTLAMAVQVEMRDMHGAQAQVPAIQRYIDAHVWEIQRRTLLTEQMRAHARAG